MGVQAETGSDAPGEKLTGTLGRVVTREQLEMLIDEVLAIQKLVSVEVQCQKCRRRQMQSISVPDAKAVALVLPRLLNRAYGRSSEASGEQDQVRFYRLTKLEELDGAVRPVEEGRR